MPQALFVVDASPKAGFGHLRRSLVLATALASEGCSCSFSTNSNDRDELIRNAGFPAVSVAVDGAKMKGYDVVVFDGYEFIGRSPGTRLNSNGLIAVIDDMGDRPLDTDIVINHNLYGDTIDYSRVAGDAVVLAGPRYSLVSPAFFSLATAVPDQNRIMISYGGTDHGQWSAPVVEALLTSAAEIQIDVVLTSDVNRDAMLGLLEGRVDARLSIHVAPVVSDVMAGCRTFVGGAGVGSLEAAAAGRQLVVSAIASNQDLSAAAFERLGVAAVSPANPQRIAQLAVSSASAIPGGILNPNGAGDLAAAILNRLT